MNFATKVTTLPKVGTKLASALKQLGITTVGELLYHFPYKYLDFSNTAEIGSLQEGQTVTISAQIDKIKAQRAFKRGLSFSIATVYDESGSIEVVWFNQPYLAKSLNIEDQIYLAGTVTRKNSRQLQLVNPVVEKFSEQNLHTGRLVPVYHSIELVYNKTLRNLIHHCLENITKWDDEFTVKNIKELDLLNVEDSIKNLHFPEKWEDIERGRLRIAFNELLPQQLAVLIKEKALRDAGSFQAELNIEAIKSFISNLPFTLTNSQKRAAWDIVNDIAQPVPMNRLLQGDVGSGKTVVIAIAALLASLSKLQTAVLAPTEILANQHYATFIELFAKFKKIKIGLLTKNTSSINGTEITKAELLKHAEKGQIDVLIGTHSLLQDKVNFKNLALLVIDEQHRFGVAQRSFLKEHFTSKPPHLLSVSATPIPRTLALSLYGNLELSDLKQMPTGRKPVITKVVPDLERDKIYHFVNQQIQMGRQAFIVTPRVEDSEKSDLKAAKQEYELLSKKIFPQYKVGLLYGKQKAKEKSETTALFAENKIQILVATSVIEIGIDFPNASVIIIEGAEQFGLAQLHQLRGRVGRGLAQSYCFLLTTTESHQDNERLQSFSKTFDGFKLAEDDLKQRGYGDLFGSMQSGFNFKFPKFITETALMRSHKVASEIINHPEEFRGLKTTLKLAKAFAQDYHGE